MSAPDPLTPEALAARLTVDALAEVIYEAEEQARAKEDQEPGVWTPWKAQTSRREQRIYRACAQAVLDSPGVAALLVEVERLTSPAVVMASPLGPLSGDDGLRLAAEVVSLRLSRLDRRDPRVNVLRLLEVGDISLAKACEALNEIAAGESPILPQPIDPDATDDSVSWRDQAERLAARLRAGERTARRRIRVYVAGPISKGDRRENVQRGVDAGMALLAAGYAPMIPHLSDFIAPDDTVGTERYEWWMEHDLAWIEAADALVRLAGESAGAEREVAHARSLGIPVYESVGALIAAASKWGRRHGGGAAVSREREIAERVVREVDEQFDRDDERKRAGLPTIAGRDRDIADLTTRLWAGEDVIRDAGALCAEFADGRLWHWLNASDTQRIALQRLADALTAFDAASSGGTATEGER